MTDKSDPFSRRHGYAATEAPIIVREDAPAGFKHAILSIADEQFGSPRDKVNVIRRALGLERTTDWSSDYLNRDAERLLRECDWFRVYDVAEALHAYFERHAGALGDHRKFEAAINDYCRAHGIGWEMVNGRFVVRGPDAQDQVAASAASRLDEAGKSTTANELREAISDLSRRPNPDITGAVQHVGAAIECLARDLCGEPSLTLGEIIKRYPHIFPGAYKKFAKGIWGIVSNKGRHIEEGGEPTFAEAMLLVGTVSAMCGYLIEANTPQH